ncbi:hypothetical protein SVAN01_11226 [Stagonosporopsis vannaccii]|nr:hypothetical protein SVAN01_11226 [Stagonosporopsis vannaccii]
MSTLQPVYRPISFVSPISDTTHRNPNSANLSTLRRISNHLKDAVTLEDTASATRRESVISDQGVRVAEGVRRASISSAKDEADDQALQAWRRKSIDEFWSKHGQQDQNGVRRKSVVGNSEGEAMVEERRRMSVGSVNGKWRRMSWGGRRGSQDE